MNAHHPFPASHLIKPATRVAGVFGLLASAHAHATAMMPPMELPMPIVVQTAASGQQAMDQSARLHALLQKYAIKCGNPACPYCYPQGTAM